MGESEVFQTRLYDDRAEVIHDYIEDRNISKAEATRRFIHWGMDNMPTEDGEEDAEPEAAQEREDRFQVLARLGEKVALLGTLLTSFAMVWVIGSSLTISAFNLTVGTFGTYLIVGATFLLFGLGTLLIIVSFAGLLYLEARYGVITDALTGAIGRAVIATFNRFSSTPSTA
jgi:hypothetical protein